MNRNGWDAFGKREHDSGPDFAFPAEGSMHPIGKLPRAQLWKDKNSPQNSYEKEKERYSHKIQYPKLSRQNSHSQRSCLCLNSCPRLQSAMTSLLQKFDRFLSRSFRKLGHNVASRTGYYLIIPVLLAFLCGTGFQQAKYEADPEYLFAPIDGTAKHERTFIEDNFHMNFSSSFDPSRITRAGRFVRLIISAKDGGTIMRQEVWDEIMELDRRIKDLRIFHDEEVYRYEDLCAIWNGKCFENKILGLSELIPEIVNGSLEINYPVMLNPYNFDVYILSVFFGGVTVNDESGIASDVKAVLINYWLRSGGVRDDMRSQLWEMGLIEGFMDHSYEHINAARFTSQTLEDELEVNTTSVIPYLGITVSMMILFSVCTLLMSDWVRSKPFMGFFGILSALFACVTSFGVLLYFGIPFIGINLAAPFLMLGIGIDDMFVMLGAWRRTRIQDSVEVRLGEAYAEAAVSITITSLTDMFSFFIGVITPFPSVQIFCIYTGTAVLMTYLFHITFFGACMAVAGRMEAGQKHALCCHIVGPKSVAERDGNCCYSFWCAGGISEEDPWNPKDNRPHAIMVFFRDCVATLLNLSSVKVIVILLFVVYLGGAIFGCLRLEEGLERRRLSRYDSYSVDFYDMEDKYFREYPYRVQVMVTGDLNYGDPETRKQLLDLHKQFENETYVAGSLYTESWIRGWYEFVDNNAEYLNINSSDEENFVFNLRDIYLSGEDNVYKLDVKFNDNLTRIVASRFVIQTYRIYNSNEDKDMMEGLRRIARESPLNVTVYHPLFIFFDQFVLVRSTSIKTISIAAAIMIVVSLIFIPNPWCSLWVGFSIISIEIGVVGYMTLWGVNLDSISMINLIMCIGFSVDFSAHISYAYLTAKVDTPAERVKDCLFTLGFPIIQGAISTIIGVVVLVFAPSYIFVTFFKTVFLVIFFGAMHGIFLLPVLLSLLGPGSSKTSHPSIQAPESMVSLPPAQKPTLVVTSLEGLVNFQKRSLDDVDSLDKDMGLGTSGESSSNSSLSEATGAASAEVIVVKTKSERPATLPAPVAYSNNGYVTDEVNDVTRGAQRPPLTSRGAAPDRIKSSSDFQVKGRRK